MAATYATKGKGVALNVGVNPSSPIPMAKYIRFTYSDDEDNAINCPEEDPEEEDLKDDPSKEFAATNSPLHSSGSSQSEEFQYYEGVQLAGGVIYFKKVYSSCP